MTDMPVFGAGIWHFATYKDRYATDGYGEPVGLLEQIDRAGAVGDLSVVDLNWPFAGYDGTLDEVKSALQRNDLKAIAITPEIYTKDFVKGSFTNPDPKVRQQRARVSHKQGQTPWTASTRPDAMASSSKAWSSSVRSAYSAAKVANASSAVLEVPR